MRSPRGPGLALLAAAALATASPSAVTVQADGRSPTPWRALDAEEAARFDLGHAVFNTSWLPAGEGSGRRDGLGPLFNAVSCDACHNSRRRGRGPQGHGPAPSDLVMQVGRRMADGRVEHGHPAFGRVINTDAIAGFRPEATVDIRYQAFERRRADGGIQRLHRPAYLVHTADGQALPADLVLRPRIASQVHGAGLFERVPDAAILANATARAGRPRGQPSWLDIAQGRRLGRFGWQANEPDIAAQTAVAFAREMGLSNPLIDTIDCGAGDRRCRHAAHGGTPEVQADLFDAVVIFQQLEALRRTPDATRHLDTDRTGEALFARSGCADCHRPAMPTVDGGRIAPYTDLLLHDLGPGLADRDAAGNPVPSLWRTAPLWGMSTAMERGGTVRLLHDGRARSIDEAIGWHGGAAADARRRYDRLGRNQRARLIQWISSL